MESRSIWLKYTNSVLLISSSILPYLGRILCSQDWVKVMMMIIGDDGIMAMVRIMVTFVFGMVTETENDDADNQDDGNIYANDDDDDDCDGNDVYYGVMTMLVMIMVKMVTLMMMVIRVMVMITMTLMSQSPKFLSWIQLKFTDINDLRKLLQL